MDNFMFDKKNFIKMFQSDGFEGCQRRVNEIKEGWTKIPLNIGVVGQTGVGKSSFINAVRHMTADDDGAAEIEPTTTMKGYEHPDNRLLIFWDIPGVGSELFRREDYLKTIQFDRYDFFILLSAGRFHENDDWLVKEISRRDKNFFFVRTKIGADISNSRRSHPNTFDEAVVLDAVRQDAFDHLKAHGGHQSHHVFLIDNYEHKKFDFQDLEQSLIREFPKLHKAAMVHAMRAGSEEMLGLTAVQLRRGRPTWVAVFVSAATACIPYIGVAPVINFITVAVCTLHCFKQLRLDDSSLERHAQVTSVDFRRLKAVVSDEFGSGLRSVIKHVVQIQGVRIFLAAMLVQQLSLRVTPAPRAVGLAIGILVSPVGTYLAVQGLLTKLETIARKVIITAADYYSG